MNMRITNLLNRSKSLIILILTFTISSCDCGYNYSYEVTNSTSNNLKFNYSKNDNTTQSIVIEPNDTYKLEGFGGWCGCSGKCYAEPMVDSIINEYEINNIKIYKNDSIASKTDFNKVKFWTFESKRRLGIYRVTIKGSDF